MYFYLLTIMGNLWVSRQKSNFWLHEKLRICLAGPFPLLYCHKFGKHLRKSLNIKTFKKIADIYFPSKDPKIRLM